MSKIYTSATKLVLLMVTITLCAWVFYKLIPVEAFTWLVWLVFGYYFNKWNSTPTV